MQAIILAGGKGTRMQDLFPDRPKALVPVGDKVFLDWQTEWLARAGVTDVHLALGHMAGMLEKWAAASGTPITTSVEPEPLGTAGGLKYVEDHVRSDPFLVLNGDTLLPNLDFKALVKTHRDSGAQVTIAVTRIEEAGRYGTIEFDEGRRITAFREKASRSEGWINGGVYLAQRDVLGLIEPDQNLSLEHDIFPDLAERGQLHACPCDPPLLDMGTPDGLKAMAEYLESH